jgi:nucleoside-diphosphate-sugar epimerase
VPDHLFIVDAVEAFERLIAQPGLSGTFNTGSGVCTSISGLIRLAEGLTGREIGIIPRPAREVDVRATVLSTARLRAATGWMPRTELEPGLGRTWAWLRAEGVVSEAPVLQ